jgi:hypothetical protein
MSVLMRSLVDDAGVTSMLARRGVVADYRQLLLDGLSRLVQDEGAGVLTGLILRRSPRVDTFFREKAGPEAAARARGLRLCFSLELEVTADEGPTYLERDVFMTWKDPDGQLSPTVAFAPRPHSP